MGGKGGREEKERGWLGTDVTNVRGAAGPKSPPRPQREEPHKTTQAPAHPKGGKEKGPRRQTRRPRTKKIVVVAPFWRPGGAQPARETKRHDRGALLIMLFPKIPRVFHPRGHIFQTTSCSPIPNPTGLSLRAHAYAVRGENAGRGGRLRGGDHAGVSASPSRRCTFFFFLDQGRRRRGHGVWPR